MPPSEPNAAYEQKFRPQFPTGRYGRRREPRRRRPWVVASALLLVVVAAGAVAWKLYDTYSAGVIDVRVTAFSVVSDSEVHVQFEVMKDRDSTVTCIVRARSRDGVEVGHADVVVSANASPTQNYVLATQKRAVTGEVLRCVPGERPSGRPAETR